MRAGLVLAALSIGVISIIIATQAEEARGSLVITGLLFLTLLTMEAIVRRVRMHAENKCAHGLRSGVQYVLLGLAFAFAFADVEELGPGPFFASKEAGTRSDYVYFSFITMATVGYGDLTARGGLGRALAVTERILGQICLVTAVAALVGNPGRTHAPGNRRTTRRWRKTRRGWRESQPP